MGKMEITNNTIGAALVDLYDVGLYYAMRTNFLHVRHQELDIASLGNMVLSACSTIYFNFDAFMPKIMGEVFGWLAFISNAFAIYFNADSLRDFLQNKYIDYQEWD